MGAVRGALVGSGIGIGTSLAANFIGGAAGSALEQKIGSGRVSLKESVVSGATNAVSGAIYGKGPLKGFGDALWKGAATAGIRYLARDWDDGESDLAGSVLGLVQGIGQMAISPYSKNRDPRRGCGVHSPLSNRVGEPMTYGYRYDVGSLKRTGNVRRKKDGFSMLGLLKEAAIGGVMGGLAGTAFYGAGKAVQALKDSVRANKGGSGSIDDVYDGVKRALEYLKQQGVPRQYRKQILESFDVRTIKLETAGESTYGLRFYGGNASAEGRYLFETFSPLTNRENLALPYEWNSMTGIQQFQVKSGTTMIIGAAAPQLSFGG